jgi:hypothetical protein
VTLKKKYLIADRLSYSIFKIGLPEGVSGNTEAIIRSKLSALYPSPLDDKEVYISRACSGRRSRTVIVKRREPGASGGKAASGLVCSGLLTVLRHPDQSGECVFIQRDFIEYVTIDKGVFCASTVHSRSLGLTLEEQLAHDQPSFRGILCDSGEKGEIEALYPDIPVTAVEEIAEGVKKRACFRVLSGGYHRRKLAVFMALICALMFCGVFLFRYHASVSAETLLMEKQTAEERVQEEKRRRERESLAAQLREEYMGYAAKTILSAYEVYQFIFFSMDTDIKIENISVTDEVFQFDAKGADAIRILKQYEQNSYVSSIQLHRVVVEEGRDIFSFRGTVRKPIAYPGDAESAEGRIAYYESRIREYREEERIKGLRLPSGVSERIGKLLRENRCGIETIQFFNTEYGLEIEYAVQGGVRDFFGFLEAVTMKGEHLDIPSIRIRMNGDGRSLSSIIRFRTGISGGKESESLFMAEEGIRMSAEELSRYFMDPVKPQRAAAVGEQIIAEEKKPALVRNSGVLVYIGTAGTREGDRFVLLKDTQKERILKLSTAVRGETAYRDGNRIVYDSADNVGVLYEGIMYEVNK